MRRDIPPLAEVRRITQKKRDAWWTVLLVDPVATPMVRLTALRTRITPNQITWGALLLGLVSAACFAMGEWRWLIAGAVVYHLSFILDCMDGKVARLTGQGSVFGAWLDYIFDRIRVMACAVALMAGQYHRTDDVRFVWLAVAVVFLDALRYINALEIYKTRHTMRKQIKSRIRAARRAEDDAGVAFMEDLLRNNPEADIEQDLRRAQDQDGTSAMDGGIDMDGREAVYSAYLPDSALGTDDEAAGQDSPYEPAYSGAASREADGERDGGTEGEPGEEGEPRRRAQVIDLHQEFRHRFPSYLRFRSFLLRHRIRTHLISGIEFQMGVFIVGPLFNAVIPVTIVSGALLLGFELAIVYKLLLSTRDFTRTIDAFEEHQSKITAAA